jgi:hypothetical protein
VLSADVEEIRQAEEVTDAVVAFERLELGGPVQRGDGASLGGRTDPSSRALTAWRAEVLAPSMVARSMGTAT